MQLESTVAKDPVAKHIQRPPQKKTEIQTTGQLLCSQEVFMKE